MGERERRRRERERNIFFSNPMAFINYTLLPKLRLLDHSLISHFPLPDLVQRVSMVLNEHTLWGQPAGAWSPSVPPAESSQYIRELMGK